MREEWKTIVNEELDGRYMVSSYGRVYNSLTNRFVSPVITGIPQYWYVNLTAGKNKKVLRRVHRLVALTFLGEEPEGFTVDHIDRNPYNNNLTNLRYADRRAQAINRDMTLMVDGKVFADLVVEDYGDCSASRMFLYRMIKDGCSYEEAKKNMERSKLYGNAWRSEQGCGRPLYEVLESTGTTLEEYLEYKERVEEYNRIVSKFKEVESFGIELNGVWYPSFKSLCSVMGVAGSTIRERMKKGMTLEEAISHEHDPVTYITIDGITKSRTDWIKYYKTTEGKVTTRMRRYGDTFEQALKHKPQRIIKHNINGIVKRNKEWFEYFNLKYSRCRKLMDTYKCMETTLNKMGVDTTGMNISPYTQ